MDYRDYIAEIPDFPVEGVLFRDITPLLANGEVYSKVVEELSAYASEKKAEVIVAPEARGFLFGCPVSTGLQIGFVPVRKPGKLPRESIYEEYALEYGTNRLEMHADAIVKGQKVVIIDDLLATGGTTQAAIKLVERLGGEVVGCAFVSELVDLKGREALKGYDVLSLIQY
jgi:adenine phosphoribosyltransferase